MLKRILRVIVGLMTKQPAPAPYATSGTGAAANGSAPDARLINELTFASRLESATADDSSLNPLIAGSLELVGLDDIREALGQSWTLVRREAEEVAEAELRRQLAKTDFYRRHGDTSYLVCFSNLNKGAAERKARQIGAKIKATLIGRIPDLAQAFTVDHFVAEVDRAELRRGDLPIADRLHGTLQRMRAEARATVNQFRSSLLKDFQLLFSPIWHTSKHIALLNRCILDMTSGCTTLAQFQALADPEQLSRTLAELDFLLLTKSLETLHQMLRLQGSGAFLVPVGFRTVNEPSSLREYTRLLALMPESYKKFVILEICGIPDATVASRLGELIAILSPFTKGLSLEVSVDDPRLASLLEQNPWALTVNLAGASSMDPQISNRLRRFTGAVAATPIRTFAHGANSIGLALAAYEAGFSYVDGPAIHPTLREPKPPMPLNPLPPPPRFSKILKRW